MTDSSHSRSVLNLATVLDGNSTFGYDGNWNKKQDNYDNENRAFTSGSDKRVAFNSPTGKKYPSSYYQSAQSWNGLEESTPNKVDPVSSSYNRLDGKTVRNSDVETEAKESSLLLQQAAMQTDLDTHKHTIEELQAKLKERDMAIADMTTRLKEKDVLVTSLEHQVTNYYNDVQKLTSSIESTAKERDETISELRRQNKELKSQGIALKKTETILEKCENERNEIQNTCELLRSEKDVLEDKCTQYKSEVNETKTKWEDEKLGLSNLQRYISILTIFDISLGAILINYYDSSKDYNELNTISIHEILRDRDLNIDQHITGWNKDDFSNLLEKFQSLSTSTEFMNTSMDLHFKDTMTQLENFESVIGALNNSSNEQLSGIKQYLSEEIQSCKQEILNGNDLREDFEKERVTLKDIIKDNEEALVQLRQKYEHILGDEANNLEFSDVESPDITRSIYDSLQLSDIDNLDNVTLRNQLKKVCINLQTPYQKLHRKVILANLLIRGDLVILLNFVNILYYELNGKNLELEELEKEAYYRYQSRRDINNLDHPLESVLSNLYDDIIFKMG